MDHPLVEWLASLPSTHKIQGQEGKFLFKKAMEPMLPNDVLYRPKMPCRWPTGSVAPSGERVRSA